MKNVSIFYAIIIIFLKLNFVVFEGFGRTNFFIITGAVEFIVEGFFGNGVASTRRSWLIGATCLTLIERQAGRLDAGCVTETDDDHHHHSCLQGAAQ
ncbi:hypothetical protein J6590_033727 [Homalodisca vitripennis]|nr:hypothetical protein J6590_033727 [Homalodisca vitripennis]